MQRIAILFLTIFSALFTTTFATQAFAEEDIAALRSEIASLKAQQSQTEVEVLKKELSELKIKMLEEKLANTEKRLEDKISTSEKRLDDKISTSEKQTDNKFEAKTDNLDTKIQFSREPSVFSTNDKSAAKTTATRQRPFALSIGYAGTSLYSTYGAISLLDGIKVGLSYTKNRFFAETLITALAGKEYTTSSYYSSCYWYGCTSSYDNLESSAQMRSLALRLGYKFGGNIVKFEPYLEIGKTSTSLSSTNLTTYAQSASDVKFGYIAPGAKLSIGSANVRLFVDVTAKQPSVFSKSEAYDVLGYVQTTVPVYIGFSFAF